MPSKVTRASRSNKPAKPRPDFPLTANGNGQWSKKIRGRVYYFGTWADPDAALNRYLEVKDDLQAGRKPRNRDGFTVKDLCNHWVRNEKSQTTEGKLVSVDGITQELNKILKSLDLKRHGISFYALRHTFETIGGESRDQVAVDAIMGHTRDDMASLYRERISDERLRDVVTHVRRWLFPHAFT